MVSGGGVVNSPQNFEVILNITPSGTPATPDPEPACLLILSTAGGTAPAAQTVTVYASSSAPIPFQASTDSAWLKVSPNLGTTSQGTPAATLVSVDLTGLKAGVYRGSVSYAFAANAVRVVNVTLVVSPAIGAAATASENLSGVLLPRAGCSPTTLVPTQTGLVNNFSAPTSWPSPLAIQVVDDCGSSVTNGQVVVSFTNGDPPLALPLIDRTKAVYSGTWVPRRSGASVTINAKVSASGFSDATVQIAGAVVPNAAPVLTPHGTVHSFAPATGAPLAPGTIVAIYGQNLASLQAQPNTIPLPSALNGTSVFIGGIASPLYFVSSGQVNAQIPYELDSSKAYQVIVQANGAVTSPDTIQLQPAVPGLAAFADGTLIAQHPDGSLVSLAAPAKAGEYLVAYLAGLGDTDHTVVTGDASPSSPLARPVVQLSLNVGTAANVPVEFAGLTPGLVGLYQMNFQVPSGLTAGNLNVTVTQGGQTSNPVILPYTP